MEIEIWKSAFLGYLGNINGFQIICKVKANYEQEIR